MHGQVNHALFGALAWVNTVDFLMHADFVLYDRLPYQIFITLEGLCLEIDCEVSILLHHLIETVSANSLTVHLREGAVEKLRASFEHNRHVSDSVAVCHL